MYTVKSVGLAAPVRSLTPGVGAGLMAPFQMQVKPVYTSEIDLCYATFVSEGFVKLLGSDEEVPIKILRDSGASQSFVRRKILPFSPISDTGSCVPVRGLGLRTMFVQNYQLKGVTLFWEMTW